MNTASILRIAGVHALLFAGGTCAAFATPWSFGVISDTQQTISDPSGQNPNTIPMNIISQVDQQFIGAGVNFVVSVGDSVDSPGTSDKNINARALFAQDLYNAGIGYFPLRGNHEAESASSGTATLNDYPQIANGVNNATPTFASNPIDSSATVAPAAKTNMSTFTVGSNFSQPATNATYNAASYAFTYNNATFVLLDQFNSANGATDTNASTIAQQQPWIDATLQTASSEGNLAFVFGHKNLLGGNHKDNLFGPQVTSADPGDGNGVNTANLTPAQQAQLAAKQAEENKFIDSLADNGVHYYISGHDHHEYDSIVTSPDGSASVHQVITSSDSSKFYSPGTPVSSNDTPVSQKLNQIGYYVYTVDGPRVRVDYYAADANTKDANGKTSAQGGDPVFNFTKQLTTGYSQNGTEFQVKQGATFAGIAHTITAGSHNGESGYVGTAMQLLGGNNLPVTSNGVTSATATNYGKALTMAIDTAWAPRANGAPNSVSDVLSLYGMTSLGTGDITPTFALALSFNAQDIAPDALGQFYIASKDANGNWVNSVDLNFGGSKNFVLGAYDSSYGLGTFGVDVSTNTAWAVINQTSGDFTVIPEPSTWALVVGGLSLGFVALRRRRA